MSAVKSRLKLFEQTQESEDMANVARGRPPLASKPPVSTKLTKAEDANANVTSKPAPKWGSAAPLNIKQDELNAIKNSLNKGSTVAPASDNNKSSQNGAVEPVPFSKMALKPVDNRRVSVPKVFQAEDSNELSKSTEPSEKVPHKIGMKVPIMPQKPKSDSSEATHPPVKTWGQKNIASTPASSTSPAEVPTPVAKTGKTAVTSPTSTTTTASNTPAQNTPAASVAAASVARNWGVKPLQTSPAVKSWNAKTSSPSPTAANTSSVSTPASPQPSNPLSDSSHEPEEENGKGKFDFRKEMKQRNSITSGALMKPAEDQRSPMTEITPNKSPHVSPTHVFNSKMNSTKPGEVQMRSPGMKPAALPDKKRQSSGTIIERKSDKKKFKKVKLSSLPPESAPPAVKPALPSNVDLTQVKAEYQKRIQDLQKESELANAADCDDIYDDGSSAPFEEVLPRRSTFKRNSDRISMIPDMGPEEEGDFYDDGVSQPTEADDIYADGETEKKEESFELIYEDEESMSPVPALETEEDKKKRLKEEAEAKKREEKERKEREKQEKEQKKKEEKEKKEKLKLLKKFNLTGNEVPVGEGTIKQDVKGSGLNLTVKRGQVVTIVRMNDNPANKWLIKIDEQTIGYVESKNIDIDPSIIKQIMVRSILGSGKNHGQCLSLLMKNGQSVDTMVNIRKNSRVPDDGDQPNYDDVPQDGTVFEDEGPEEIYEEL